MDKRVRLIGCDALKREVAWLIDKNHWPVDLDLSGSVCRVDPDAQAGTIVGTLTRHPRSAAIAFYGACHPKMDDILAEVGIKRLPGQNCVEMLLGSHAFAEEISQGAYFLLEEWAVQWPEYVRGVFGAKWEVIREIFQGDRKYLLGLKTPCSGDFEAAAAEAGRLVGLPVRWRSVSLDCLEALLGEALRNRQEGVACPM